MSEPDKKPSESQPKETNPKTDSPKPERPIKPNDRIEKSSDSGFWEKK